MRERYIYLFMGLAAFIVGYSYGFFTDTGEAATRNSYRASAAALTFVAPEAKASSKDTPNETITLSRSNTVLFRGVVMPSSVAKAQQELLEKSKKLGRGKPIYIVLDTPGGDISSGGMLIDTAESLHRPVHTVTLFSASMGFNIVQRLGTRYITPSGTLMAHRARVEGVGGQVPGEFLTAVATIYRQVTKMEMQNAARLGIGFEAYTALVKDEYWVTGEDAVAANAADSLADIQCDESLSGTHTETLATMFGNADVTWADCPAISSPLDVKFTGLDINEKETDRLKHDYNLLRRALTGAR